MYEIIPNLFLASYSDAKEAVDEDMYVVNCTKDLPMLANDGIRIAVDDNEASANMKEMFLKMLEVPQRIHEELDAGRAVVVHCLAGQQRSAAMVAAYLMKYCGMNLETAVRLIRERKRDAFFWSINFLDPLQRFEMLMGCS